MNATNIEQTHAALVETDAAERLGYPVLVKAAGGGGGIGMAIVDAPGRLERALQKRARGLLLVVTQERSERDPAVIVGALGYFVDIYDLILFSILRIPSLKALGYSGPDLVSYGILLLNCQMIGMLVGGVLWGMLGDRIGRIQLLFGSILL